MKPFRYDKNLRRLWVFNKRIHHGAVGFVITITGIVLMIDDIKDIPWLYDNN